jgi:hypothetical protein
VEDWCFEIPKDFMKYCWSYWFTPHFCQLCSGTQMLQENIMNLIWYWCNGAEPGLPFVGAPWHTDPWVKGEKIHRAWLAGQIFNATCIICALLSLQLFAPPCSVVSLVLQQGQHRVILVFWLILIAPVHFYLHGVRVWISNKDIMQTAAALDMDSIYHEQVDPLDRRR